LLTSTPTKFMVPIHALFWNGSLAMKPYGSSQPVNDQKRRRWISLSLVIIGAALVALVGRPAFHLIRVVWHDSPPGQFKPLPPGQADDVSRLNQIPVAEIWPIPEEPEAAEQQLRELLERARESKHRVSVAGARHSMGGHTLYPDGVVINMIPFRRMSLDAEHNLLTVGAGALWTEILPYLNAQGRSIEVMQSDSAFSVGGSLSVNCHGWQFGRPPIASTVESFRLMQADGTIVRCSREENRELFSLVLGGYGLFGIILDAELRVVPNVRLRLEQFQSPVPGALARLDHKLSNAPNPALVYARLNISPARLFEDVMVSLYYPEATGEIPPLSEPGMLGLSRAVFRGSVDSDYGKELRWFAETRVQPYLGSKFASRNQLLSETPDWYLNRSTNATDILHEYFVPRSEATGFLVNARRIIREHRGDLLNATVRDVETDSDTFLRYAREPVIAFVLFFNQARTREGDERMQAMTRELIDAALRSRGCYYLPYRLHATSEQFHRAYPQAREFFRLKRRYDPDERFQNQFYVRYGLERN
ncbi:MAG TPA: FAD-binding oxidoreductase, partial [Verrucomicrobiota bacterium]|nr:FAD-binding oxidoreductase [Verrucomicrobiota bacterium]